MPMDRLYTEAKISKAMTGEQWETDGNGNPIVIIEASNDNLDYEGERVLQQALIDSQDYFKTNGVISYDHKHLLTGEMAKAYDSDYNPEKYIIGKPLDVWLAPGKNGIPTVKVKAVLSKSNAIAKEIISKLKDGLGTVFASVGGRRVLKSNEFNPDTLESAPTIKRVDWDEVALTYKPVNQTLGPTILSPVEFVKALSAGSSVDPAAMSGGNTLQVQHLDKDPVRALMVGLRDKKIKCDKDVISHLVKSGMSETEAGRILKMLINKNYIGDVIMAEENKASEVIDESTDELKKALEDLEDNGGSTMEDGNYVVKGGFLYKAMKDGSYEKKDEEAPDYEPDDDDEEEDEKVEKSLFDDNVYDATADVIDLKKSVKNVNAQISDLKDMVKSLADVVAKQNSVVKAMGEKTLEDHDMLKAIHDAPKPRQTNVQNIQTIERFEKSVQDKLAKVTAGSLLKSMIDNKVDGNVQADVNFAFRKGGMARVAAAHPEIVDMLVKE